MVLDGREEKEASIQCGSWPISILVTTTIFAFPLSRYLAWIMDGRYQPPGCFGDRAASRYRAAELEAVRARAAAVQHRDVRVRLLVLALQPYLPLNPDGKGMLAPTTIFNTATSFLTNTNLQHYSGEVHLSYFSQLFFIVWNMFVSAVVGFCALAAIIRGLARRHAHGQLLRRHVAGASSTCSCRLPASWACC